MAFTDAPRNLDQAVLVVSNSGATDVAAVDRVVSVLTENTLLEYQAQQPLGEKIWTNDIEPEL